LLIDWYGTKALPHLGVRAPEGARLKCAAIALAAAIIALSVGESRSESADPAQSMDVGLTERVVADRVSGIAIAGFDPVSYFVSGRPVQGSADYELVWQGAAWRFANEGNLAAFRADPTVYAPQFGGYDAAAVGRGIPLPGDPHVFAVTGDRLFLFRDEPSRAEFLSRPGSVAASNAAWTTLQKTLIP
jgi:YHS domain-containing protein